MREWKYRIEYDGKILRSLINKEQTIENVTAIYKQMVVCLNSLKKQLKGEDKEEYEYEIESMVDDLECARPDLEDNSLVYSEEEEKLNYYLRDFYDLCDDICAWIGV